MAATSQVRHAAAALGRRSHANADQSHVGALDEINRVLMETIDTRTLFLDHTSSRESAWQRQTCCRTSSQFVISSVMVGFGCRQSSAARDAGGQMEKHWLGEDQPF